MSSDPMALLHGLDPAPTATAPPIETLWRRLEGAGLSVRAPDAGGGRSTECAEPEDSVASVRVGRSRRTSGWGSRVLVGGLILVAVAIGLGAVLVLHSSRPAVNPAVPVQQAIPPPSRGLVGILGVLRRPQTAADRDLPPSIANFIHHGFAGKPVMSLVRVAAVLPNGEKVVLAPMRPRHGRVWPKGSGESKSAPRRGLRLAVFGVGGAACCVTPAAIEKGKDSLSGSSGSGNQVVIVIPDGVARISIATPHPITAPVHNNVAVFTTPQTIENPTAHTMTWYGPNGAIVRRIRPATG